MWPQRRGPSVRISSTARSRHGILKPGERMGADRSGKRLGRFPLVRTDARLRASQDHVVCASGLRVGQGPRRHASYPSPEASCERLCPATPRICPVTARTIGNEAKVVCAGDQVTGGDLESVNAGLVAALCCCTYVAHPFDGTSVCCQDGCSRNRSTRKEVVMIAATDTGVVPMRVSRAV